MGEILSQAEVEAILSAIEPSRPGPRVPLPETRPPQWESHDFRQPEPLHGAALKLVQGLHEGICDRWQSRLASLLQTAVTVRPLTACQSTATEFFGANPSASIECVIAHPGTAVESMVVWSTDLARQAIGRMLGGADEVGAEDCALTKIELRLLGRLNEAVVGELSLLMGESLEVSQVVQIPDAIHDPFHAFPAAWFSFEVSGIGTGGVIHLAIPSGLGTLGTAARTLPEHLHSGLDVVPPGIQQISVRVSAILATLKLTAADLAGLQLGDIVMTDVASNDAIAFTLDGRRLGNAVIGTHLGRKALRVTQ